MEDLRSSRRPAKLSDGDVFGGPPKYPAPFAAKSDDYAEIFGGICGSCSIPFLDLPPAAETYDGGERIDYSEIFGGFNGGDFAVDYEELFSEKRKAAGSSASSNGRVRMDARFGQRAEVSDLLPEGDSKNYGASLEKNKLLSSDNQSDDGSKQFNMLYHRTSRGSIEDVISGKTHITELHAVPGYTYMINSCSSQDVRSNNSPNIQTNDLTNNVRYNRQLNDLKQEKAASSTSSIDKTKSSRADLRTNLKEYSARHAASDDDPVNVKHHSRSSSNYSASSGEIPYPDSTYISISDINLRTRPSRVPPPSRAPPKLASKQEHNKIRQIHYSIGASRSHGRQGVAKDSSSHFLDVEVDASSAAKASAAAMKEAMEQAEARLKGAKELLERKRDTRKKPAHKEGAKYDESKEVKDSDVVKDFSELTARKLLPKGSKGMKEYALNDTNKGTKVGKVSPNHGEQERYVVTAEESHQMGQGNGFKSSQMCYKSEDVSGEWKNVDQFYELINNEKKSGAVKEASQQEDVEKKTKTTTKVNEEKEIYSEKDELANEFKRTVKLHKVNETIERDDIDGNPKVCNMTSKQEFRKIPDEILETCILNEPEASSSSYHRNANKKMQAAQEALISGGELKKPDAVEEASCEENEMNLESSNNSFRFEEIYHDDEVNRKLQPAKEACEHGEEEEELSGTCVTSACEENMKMFRRTAVQNENENEMEVNSGTLVREAEEERAACEEAYLYENSDCTSGNGKLESCNAENECKLEGTISVSKHVEIEKSNEVQGPCIPVENDLHTEANQDGNEMKENAVEVKPALGTMRLGVSEKKMSSAKETSWPDYGVETREAQPELKQNEKKQNADQTPSVVENIIDPGVLGDDHTERENGKFKEGNGVLGSEEAHPHCDAAQEDFQRVADEDIGDVQQGSSAQNKDLGDAAEDIFRKSRSSSHDATETPGTVVSENSESGAHKREKMDSEETIERETCHEKEQARILEEEKEREREREKDRLAVERATREAHERAITEARERAERIAVERVTAEARQRALAEAREKAEKASAEALEKALVEKALKEAKLRAERAAVERATAEARERAVEKALAERAAADARQRAERLNSMSRDKNRKENEAGDSFRASDKEDREIKLKPSSSDVLQDIRFKSTGSSSSSQRDSSAHGEVESPLRCKARLERHQRTVERAAKALAEKNLRDILAQREQAERNRLAEALDADVKRWSTGKEGNLRALLSTLQYILGPESGWQPIPLTAVITAAAVKKAYRKATLCVHPDKLQQRGASIQQKYICEKVFDLLKGCGKEIRRKISLNQLKDYNKTIFRPQGREDA